MKKLVLLLLMCVASLSISAQVYYYKYLNTINTNGVKTKINNFYSGRDIYMTFVNDGNILAPFTDKDGTNEGFYCTYKGTSNGIITYKGLISDNAAAWGAALMINALLKGYSGGEGKIKFYFSSDYDRLNIEMGNGLIHVLQHYSSPEEEQAPSSLY